MTASHTRRSRCLALLLATLLVAACGPSSSSGTPGAPGSAPALTSAPATPSSSTAPRPTAPSAPASPGTPIAGLAVQLRPVVENLTDPLDIAAPRDGSGRILVVEQPGRIRLVRDGQLLTRPVLDLRDQIASGGERGLLGLALHPDFPDDPRLFVDYTDLGGDTVVSEFRLDPDDGDIADPRSERLLIQIDQPFPNHNGGAVSFGPDGMLYVSTGDGGSGGDPQGNGQRLDTLLAKILRIDVDGEPSSGRPYRVPDDNPFLGTADAMPEIWLTGLRNPWRMHFDPLTGDLWIGDVGQGQWEEIDVAPAGTGGLNFGWNVMEGAHCFEPQAGCDEDGLTLPVTEYGHGLGCAVIGGVVVRDADQPLLDGRYVFSDSCSGNVWLINAAAAAAAGGPVEPVLVASTGRSISSIASVEDGRVLATDLAGGTLYELVAVAD